jgi:hypothetical protein
MTSTAKREAAEMARETKKAKNESATTTSSGLATYSTSEKYEFIILKIIINHFIDS